MTRNLNLYFGVALAAGCLLAACGGDDKEETPPRMVTLTFSVDDTANKTFTSGDALAWKGAMKWDKATNTVVKAGWDGPFAPLYDDGPAPDGHEKDGATAGDHIWTTAVKMAAPAEDTTIEYGAGFGDNAGNWIWPDDNGTFVIGPNSGDTIEVNGMAVPAFGTTDLRVEIDSTKLADGYDAAGGVKVKMNITYWAEVDCVKDGDVYRLDLSTVAKKGALHNVGLLKAGDKPEFVFVFGTKEYKDSDGAVQAGVKAFTKADGASDWAPQAVSKAENGNTIILVP